MPRRSSCLRRTDKSSAIARKQRMIAAWQSALKPIRSSLLVRSPRFDSASPTSPARANSRILSSESAGPSSAWLTGSANSKHDSTQPPLTESRLGGDLDQFDRGGSELVGVHPWTEMI